MQPEDAPQGQENLDTGQSAEPTAPEQSQAPASPQQEAENSLYQEVLSSIQDETQKKLLEPHLKSWDQKVTGRFQQIHEQYKPYKDLGSPEDLARAQQVYDLLANNPQQVYNLLHQQFGQPVAPPQPVQQATPEDPYANYDPEIADYFRRQDDRNSQMEKALTLMSTMLTRQAREVQEAQEDQQLDEYLAGLKGKFGDYDETYVLTRMQNGLTGEAAVKEYQAIVNRGNAAQQQVNQAAPPVLNGSGSIAPSNGFDVSKLNAEERKGLVAQIISRVRDA